jgi:hypothetical protein
MPSRLLAVADPGLAAAIDEVNAIGRLYPNRSKVVLAATKADLKSLSGDYDVVHLSMHGEFNEREPMLSYLQLKPSPPDNGRGRVDAKATFRPGGLQRRNASNVIPRSCPVFGTIRASAPGLCLPFGIG